MKKRSPQTLITSPFVPFRNREMDKSSGGVIHILFFENRIITRYALMKAIPWDGVRKSLWVSVIAGISFALIGFFLLGSTYMAILFVFLAFQSCQALQG